MYASGSESLIKQAREIQEEELQKFYGRVYKQLHSGKEAGGEVIDSLQRLHLIVSATKYARLLPPDLVKKLQMLLRSPSCLEQLQVLSSSILRESLPLSLNNLSTELSQDSRALSYLASVVLTQAGSKDDLLPVCQYLLKCLESRQPETQVPRHTLPILSKMYSFSPDILTEDQVNVVSRKLADWLRYASIHQGASMSSGGFFTSPRTRQPALMTEVDGAVAGDFFTVLCVGQSYTEDHWMNIYTFSMIKIWLLTYDTDGSSNTESAQLKTDQVIHTSPPQQDDRSELDSSVMSMVSATSSSSRMLPPKERLREKAFEYCHRLIEQSDRKALKKADAELQKACIVESVSIMDIICSVDPSYVYRGFPCIKALYGRLSADLAFARVLLPIAQFYLNHSETAAVESEAVFCHLFSRFPADLFNEPMLAYEFVQFCLHNVSVLQEKVAMYRHSFPNLLKFLAWNSPGLISEFMELLPSLLATETAIELLHTLLDLPCLAAALDLQHRSAWYQVADRALWDQQGSKITASLDAFRQPSYRGLFLYILRPEAGTGDTIDRLSMLHNALEGMTESPRVLRCAQIVPVLLHVYFNTITQMADGKMMNQLLLVLLERSSLLYKIKNFSAEVQRVFSTQLQVLCKLHPMLIVDQYKELLEFTSTTTNIYTKEDFYTHVVWVIGEYLSLSYDPRCTVELITSFFEGLEAVLFEITQVRQSASPLSYTPRLLTVLMTALAKLASRSQDLIPRASLFLSKMRSFALSGRVASCFSEEDSEEIITRSHELINLLKLPNVAQFVLTPSAQGDCPRWHRDTNAALPQRMRAISGLLQSHSSFLPA
ncbi:AP-5 complex subunit zeta-1 isoform X1 [Tachysurus fulvidraco]|uniref:AP-5 complex subunit zeta-1 isoform X1 n=1 Tax=Tachysurus fulvidraco TaxID=1234273 RepID=UPI001FEF16EA|nr:AP-5 complex subunit zeta-1 isoform X1 [Tachysurus fulvidraco]XP_027015079.2 AP-5 complex subunit zeta-1 isoform X1 [Tachysurus fulvidraco]